MPEHIKLKGNLTQDDFLQLYKKCKDKRLAERYHSMYLSFMYSWEEIAVIVGREYQTVLEWAKLYNEHGLELGKPPGRPSALTKEPNDRSEECGKAVPMGDWPQVQQLDCQNASKMDNWQVWSVVL